MTLGAEPKKVKILGGLLVLAVVTYFVSSSSSSDERSGYKPPTSRSGIAGNSAKAPELRLRSTHPEPPRALPAPLSGSFVQPFVRSAGRPGPIRRPSIPRCVSIYWRSCSR